MNIFQMNDEEVVQVISARASVRRDRQKSLAMLSQGELAEVAHSLNLDVEDYSTDLELIAAIAESEYPNVTAAVPNFDPALDKSSAWFTPGGGHVIKATPASPFEYPDITGMAGPVTMTAREEEQADIFKSKILFTLQSLNGGRVREAYSAIKELCQDLDWETDLDRDWNDPMPTYTEVDIEYALRAGLGGILPGDVQEALINLATTRTRNGETADAFQARINERRVALFSLTDSRWVEKQIRRYMDGHWGSASVDAVVAAAIDNRPEAEQIADPARQASRIVQGEQVQLDRYLVPDHIDQPTSAQPVQVHLDPASTLVIDDEPITAPYAQVVRKIRDNPQA